MTRWTSFCPTLPGVMVTSAITPALDKVVVNTLEAATARGGRATSAAARPTTPMPMSASTNTLYLSAGGPSLRSTHCDTPPIATSTVTTATFTRSVRPHEVLVTSSRLPASFKVCSTPVPTISGTATMDIRLNRRTIPSDSGSVNHALVPNANIKRPPIHSAIDARCTASIPIHSAAGCCALAWPMVAKVRISAIDSANAAPRHTSLARRANVKRTTANASTRIDRTSNTDAVCEPTTLPHTDGLIASEAVPATTLAPYKPNDPSEPTSRNAHASHSNMRLDAESADCTASRPPPTKTINPINASSRAPVSSRPTVELAAALPLTLSISAPTSTPDCPSAAVPTWKLKTPSTTWPSSDGTRHTTTYTPLPMVGTDACTAAAAPAASGAPVGINLAFWS